MIADDYLQLRSELESALGDLARLATDTRREPSGGDTIMALLRDVREPLLFVVVGEVKAGKSSLLNALFGQEFSRVDVLPATDRVYIFKYGNAAQAIEISPQVVERYEPIAFLRDFNVVDTPGTNTMVDAHQEITEGFIPRADLVLFVFSIVNPWSQSAWDLLNFVGKKWLKNIVFVLQQADLRDAEQVEVILRHLRETAFAKLGFAPPMFAVSAREALLAKTGPEETRELLWAKSNFGALEAQIDRTVAESEARMTKLESTARTGGVVLEEISAGIKSSYATIVRDEEELARVSGFLGERKGQTLRQVAGFLRGVEQACRECAVAGTELLEEKLSFWKTWRLVWRRAAWERDFQADVEGKLRHTIQPQIERAVQLLETDLRGIWPQLQGTLEAHFATDGRSRVTELAPDFARQRQALLQSVGLTLAERIAGRAIEEQLERMFNETASWLRLPAGVAAAGGIVTVIAAMSSAAVADVTGVLAASAAVVGTVVAFTQRRRILRAYEREMERKRTELTVAIEREMEHAIALFYGEIATAFQPLAAFCATERERYEPLRNRAEKLGETFSRLQFALAQPR